MNAVRISGKLECDAQLRERADGTESAFFIVGVERAQKDANGRPVKDIITCRLDGPKAAKMVQDARKGTRIAVQGELHLESYIDQWGSLRNWTEIEASTVHLAGQKAAEAAR